MFTLWYPDSADGVHPFMVLLAALAIDAVLGDPAALWRAVPHPVAAFGNLIGWIERRINSPDRGGATRFALGLTLTLIAVGAAGAIGWAVAWGMRGFTGGWMVEAAIAGVLIAGRGLYDHVRAVADGLEKGLETGRAAVSRIVGRDPGTLDSPAVARAAIESAAENFSDGVVAPVFWFAVLGLPGLAAYKAANTLDSMIGHRDARFEHFGKAAARLDDVLNWVPARLAGLLIAMAAVARAPEALRALRRDAARHRSVNAGWQEAPMAGALGLALAGPRSYGETIIDDAWMGDGRRDAAPADIRRALALYLRACVLLAALVASGLAL